MIQYIIYKPIELRQTDVDLWSKFIRFVHARLQVSTCSSNDLGHPD